MREGARASSQASIHHAGGTGGEAVGMGNPDEFLHDLVSLPAAAEILQLHRATVNDMVNSGRLRGYRLGSHWYVRASELDLFALSYQRPRSARRRLSGASRQHWTQELLRWLLHWESATTEELDKVLDLHIGNIRKYLALCEQDGLATRDEFGYWTPTDEGRMRARALPAPGRVAAS